MPGFFAGAAGAIVVLTAIRWAHWRHHHGSWKHGSWNLKRRLFERLDTTDGQEKIINAATEDLKARGKEVFSELEQLRKELGRSLRGSQFDPAPVRESFARQRALIDALEEALTGHMDKLHEALDENQRATLGELIKDGPRHSMRGCGWRGVHRPLHYRAC
jgi:hypothetical protein